MSSWTDFNRAAYSFYYWWRHKGQGRASLRWTKEFRPTVEEGGGGRSILVFLWGRLGDTLISLPLIKGLAALFPKERLVCVGRPEVGPLLDGIVDCFIPFHQSKWMTSKEYRKVFFASFSMPIAAIFGDCHLFYGGFFFFKGLIERLEADKKIFYEGYAGSQLIAPWRIYPNGCSLIPTMPAGPEAKWESGDFHLWHHGKHYLRGIAQVMGLNEDVLSQYLSSPLSGFPGDSSLLAKHGLDKGNYIVLQALSNNRKKDYPQALWREALAPFTGEKFVLLGTDKERPAVAPLGLANTINLCGSTTLAQAASIIKGAKAFVGLDSGLTHLALHLGKPTVCVSQNANLGFFHPYPEEMGLPKAELVWNPAFTNCSGCINVCCKEPIWKTALKGTLCLRSLDPKRVTQAVERLMFQRG